MEAQRLVASDEGRNLRLSGIYVRVVEDVEDGPGHTIDKVTPT